MVEFSSEQLADIGARNLAQFDYRLQINSNADENYSGVHLVAAVSLAASPSYSKDMKDVGFSDQSGVSQPDVNGNCTIHITGEDDIEAAVENGIVGDWALERDVVKVALNNLSGLGYRLQADPKYGTINLIAEVNPVHALAYKEDMERAGFENKHSVFRGPASNCGVNIVQISGCDDVERAINNNILGEDQAAVCVGALRSLGHIFADQPSDLSQGLSTPSQD